MAPELGDVATAAAPVQPSHHDAASPSKTSPSPSNPAAADSAARLNPLKRPREDNSTSPRSPAYKSSRTGGRNTTSIQRTAAAAALEAERRRKEEDQARGNTLVVGEGPTETDLIPLIRDVVAMSRPNDAPAAPTANMEATTKPSTTVTIPPTGSAEGNAASSPRSATSGGVSASIAGATVTESPTAMDIDPKADEGQHPAGQEDKTTPNSLSYPGPLHTGGGSMPAPPSRGMSYPMPSSGQTSPTSGTAKKHKCPFCDTVFTRHHNLKSHLLTHSQEKPYVCQQCDMRFRRLHDLKRHGKLHTGEKPHVCPKCDRKFARGDALARHSKGAGGCAGRRSSMGSFAEDDGTGTSMTEGDDSTMTGVMYGNEEDMPEDERRRQSLPSIKAQHVAGQAHSRTYPPAGGGPQRAATTGGLFPPSGSSTTTSPSMPNSTGSGHTPSTSISSMPMSAGSGSMYSQGMTESPKPLSPAVPNQPGQDGPLGRQRSPSMTQQFQQQHYGRRPSGRRTPPNLSLPGGPATKLPALTNIAPHDARYAGGKGTRAASGPQTAENTGNMFTSDIQGLWAYVHSLEERVAQMEKMDKEKQAHINTLLNDLAELKKQKDPAVSAPETTSSYGAAASPEAAPAPAPAPTATSKKQ